MMADLVIAQARSKTRKRATTLTDADLRTLLAQVEQVWEPVLGVPAMVRFQVMIGTERAGTISKLRQDDHQYPWKAYDQAGAFLDQYHGASARTHAVAEVLAAHLLKGGEA